MIRILCKTPVTCSSQSNKSRKVDKLSKAKDALYDLHRKRKTRLVNMVSNSKQCIEDDLKELDNIARTLFKDHKEETTDLTIIENVDVENDDDFFEKM